MPCKCFLHSFRITCRAEEWPELLWCRCLLSMQYLVAWGSGFPGKGALLCLRGLLEPLAGSSGWLTEQQKQTESRGEIDDFSFFFIFNMSLREKLLSIGLRGRRWLEWCLMADFSACPWASYRGGAPVWSKTRLPIQMSFVGLDIAY